MKCKICESEAVHFANARTLNKYDIDYFQCQNCGFVQTEEPYWLSEVYTIPIASNSESPLFQTMPLIQRDYL